MPYGQTRFLSAWVTSGTQIPTLGILPVGAYVVRVHIHCTVAFNSSGTDEIRVGYSSDTDAYATLTDTSTVGVKSVTLGSGIGFDGTARQVLAEYVNGGTEPSLGRSIVIVEYFLLPPQP